MLKRLIDDYNWVVRQDYCRAFYPRRADMIRLVVSMNKWIRKGQQQLAADMMMLELLEQGRL